MSLRVSFQSRGFVAKLTPPGLDYRVNSMQWNAIGGCAEASITVFGSPDELWEMIELLRCPVRIENERGTALWWGYVHDARVRVGAIEVGTSLAAMSNKVAVAYSYVQPGTQTVGQRKTTSWASDADSIAEFGTKEFLSSQGGLSDAAAEARRAAILASRKWPQGVASSFGSPRGRVTYSGADNSQSATLLCRGWWSTLDWRYASIASAPGVTYATTSATEQIVGSTSANTKMMQVVTLSGRSLNALGLSVYAKKAGSPADNLVLSLYQADDSTDAPTGSALGSVNIAGSSLTTSLAWVAGTFAAEKNMDPAKDYCVQVSRSGSPDASNYYIINVNEGLGYTGGFLRIYDGADWVARSPDADMPFVISVNNNLESTYQIRELAGTYGEFITGIDVEEDSGIILPSYRDGDTLTLGEIEELLKAGGANGRRLLCAVDIDRRLRVWEEPASTSVLYRINRDGVLMDKIFAALDEYAPPVGVWVRLTDVIPGNADVTKLISPELQFIEAASWSKDSGMQLAFRGQPSIEDMFKIKR